MSNNTPDVKPDNLPEDIFGISNSGSCWCTVSSYYQQPHSILNIKIEPSKSPEDTFFVRFDPVAYFAGPTYWHGAKFELSSVDEHENIRRIVDKDPTLKDYRIFIVKAEPINVRILALNVSIQNGSQARGDIMNASRPMR